MEIPEREPVPASDVLRNSGHLCEAPVIRTVLALIALSWASCLQASVLDARVVGVSDGDTITVLDAQNTSHKVRLSGIDAPEKRQPFGSSSKTHLSHLVFGRDVRVEWKKSDRYGRLVGKVWVALPECRAAICPKTVDASLAQLTVGMAWWYRHFAKEQPPNDRGRYEFAEHEARAKRAGLWRDDQPIAPWEWRHHQE